MAPALADSGAAASGRWRDLGKRALTAIVLAPVVLFCLWRGAPAWDLLIGVASVGLAYEWAGLCHVGIGSPPGLGLAGAILAIWLLTATGLWLAAIAAIPAGALLVWLVAKAAARRRLAAGILYIGPSIPALIWLRAGGSGLADMLIVLLVVWASDIGAYLAGRWLGGPKLAPSISPGKTWSGAVGGLLGALLVAAIAALWLHGAIGGGGATGLFCLLAAGLSAVSQAGDLGESAIKRRFGVKDSGWLVPGHGGLFDRLDGILAAAPAAAALALALGRGVVVSG